MKFIKLHAGATFNYMATLHEIRRSVIQKEKEKENPTNNSTRDKLDYNQQDDTNKIPPVVGNTQIL